MKANSSNIAIKIIKSGANNAGDVNQKGIVTSLKLASLIKKPVEDSNDIELYSTPVIYNNADNSKSLEMLCLHDFTMPVT